MKYITLVSLIFLGLLHQVKAQIKIDTTNMSIYFEKIVEAPDLSKDQIYTKVKLWYTEAFKNAGEVIELDDKESGVITGRFTDRYSISASTFPFYHSLKINFKEGKARIRIDNIKNAEHGYSIESYILKKDYTFRNMYAKTKAELEASCEGLISTLEKSILLKEGDW